MVEGMNKCDKITKFKMHAIFFFLAVIDDLWTPFKQLQHHIQTFLITNSQDTNIASFEALLRKNKQHFSALLTNPVSCCCKTSSVEFKLNFFP